MSYERRIVVDYLGSDRRGGKPFARALDGIAILRRRGSRKRREQPGQTILSLDGREVRSAVELYVSHSSWAYQAPPDNSRSAQELWFGILTPSNRFNLVVDADGPVLKATKMALFARITNITGLRRTDGWVDSSKIVKISR
jgi:hypothetical protein